VDGGNWSVIAEFTEIETGKRNDRPQLERALAACRKHKARLVIAKLDRLSGNLAFIATLMDSSIEFIAVDNPHANKLTLHILAAVAQHEREMIAARTKAALQASKARGTKLGAMAPKTLPRPIAQTLKREPRLSRRLSRNSSPSPCLPGPSRASWRRERCQRRRAEHGTLRPCCGS
jgi:DNA invertase Pin-like site-specific DNA recombinase